MKLLLASLSLALVGTSVSSAQVFRPSTTTGAVLGAVAGGLIGGHNGDRWAQGMAVGAVAGAVIGSAFEPAPVACPAPTVVYPATPATVVYPSYPSAPATVVYAPSSPQVVYVPAAPQVVYVPSAPTVVYAPAPVVTYGYTRTPRSCPPPAPVVVVPRTSPYGYRPHHYGPERR